MKTELFEQPEQSEAWKSETCHTCEHRERWQCGTKVFQYCRKRNSNRTDNGLLKIKCEDKACNLYEKIK